PGTCAEPVSQSHALSRLGRLNRCPSRLLAPRSTKSRLPADNHQPTLDNGGMRLLITADLHYNHPRSRALAEDVIEQINAERPDAVLVAGDTAVADGDALERCLGLFNVDGPKLFIAGNHELWTHGPD